MGPPNAVLAAKPTSSVMMISTLGALDDSAAVAALLGGSIRRSSA
jgi:hypothetical protein